MGDVGQHGQVEITVADAIPLRRQPMRRGFDHRVVAARVDHLAQHRLHFQRLGRGLTGQIAPPARPDLEIDGGHEPTGVPALIQHMRYQRGGRRLTLGAGNPHHAQLAAGIAVKGRGQRRQRSARVGHAHQGSAASIKLAKRRRILIHDGHGTLRESCANEPVAIRMRAFDRHKQPTGHHLARVIGHARNWPFTRPDDLGSGQTRKQLA